MALATWNSNKQSWFPRLASGLKILYDLEQNNFHQIPFSFQYVKIVEETQCYIYKSHLMGKASFWNLYTSAIWNFCFRSLSESRTNRTSLPAAASLLYFLCQELRSEKRMRWSQARFWIGKLKRGIFTAFPTYIYLELPGFIFLRPTNLKLLPWTWEARKN